MTTTDSATNEAGNAPVLKGPPVAGTEEDTLVGALERQRRTFRWKCADLDTAGLRATTAGSTMTIAGLLKHLALVEADYFAWKLLGESPGAPFESIDWDQDPDWEWRTALDDTPSQLYDLYDANVARARANLARALSREGADGGLDGLAHYTSPDGDRPSLRRILIDMIEEYARHTGHADILRESVDGRVGEDPPA
ncbi:DinB family protein [Nocardioides speluncae]|uniref:DinB family protein n=1 Tax=Nocardioides speluncae TaxID=2670337 RepID=UPI000D696B2A|nr:DinB family protein [Nocardioides speluncae]